MKITFVGGGTGGHFYPIIAVAEEVILISDEKRLIQPDLYYIGPDPYDEKILYENEIKYVHAPAGKLRRYPSIKNFFDLFKTIFGTIKAVFVLFSIYPDVVFSKGGYTSVPTVLAARFLRIPVIIHESDSIPGRANMLASKFAHRIGIAYPQAIDYFPEKLRDKIAVVGVPVRKEILHPQREGSHEFLGFTHEVPTLLVLGGSQGAKRINDILLEALPDLIEHYQIIHQTGKAHEEEIIGTANLILQDHPLKNRYRGFGYLDDLAMRMSAGAADLVVSRAGSTTIFEASAWGKPMILIPISEDVSRDQRKNAFAVARIGAALVIEESNLTHHVLVTEIDRLMSDPDKMQRMTDATQTIYRPDAARKIAEQLVSIGIQHET